MGFIDKGTNNSLNAYLTQLGRELMLTGSTNSTIATYFILGDSDRNYTVSTNDRIKSMLVPDITGDKTDSLFSIAPNNFIRHTVGAMKNVENTGGGFIKKQVYTPSPDLIGSDVKMLFASRLDSVVDEEKTLMGNLYKTFNLPITPQDKENYITGEFYASALEGFNTDEILVIEVPKNTYGEMIDGKTIKLELPKEGGGTFEIFSSFFENPLLNEIGNQLYSDNNKFSEFFGGQYNIGILPNQESYATPREGYASNVSYLFCDDVMRPQGNPSFTWKNSGNYFTTQENVPENKIKDKHPAVLKGTNKDKAVGIAYLDKGFIVITDQFIINNIKNNKTYVDVPNTNGLIKQFYYPESKLQFSSYNTEFIQHVVCICLPNEFYTTTNPTYDPNVNDAIAVTEVGIYNNNYELIAIAKTNRPLPKDRVSVLSFDIMIRV